MSASCLTRNHGRWQMADPELWRAVQSGDPRQLHALMRAVKPSVTAGKHMRGEPASRSDGIHGGVFMFQLFSDEFCRHVGQRGGVPWSTWQTRWSKGEGAVERMCFY